MSVSTETNARSQTGKSSSRWAIYAVVAFFAASSWMAVSSPAHALTPRKGGDSVLGVQIRPEATFADPLPDVEQDEHEVIAGREQCERMLADETPITYAFSLAASARNVVATEDIMFFAVPVSDTPDDFDCDHDDIDSCEAVTDRTIFELDVEDGEAGAQSVQTVSVDFDDLVDEAIEDLPYAEELVPIESTADCHPDDEDAFEQQYVVRLILRGETAGAAKRLADAAIRIDTIRPPPPSSIVDVTATESTLHLVWEQAERGDAERYHAFWSTEDITGMDIEALEDSDAERRQITLQNDDPDGTTFEGTVGLEGVDTDDPDERVFVAIVSRDEAENFSQPTFAEEGIEVLPVIDFWEGYREAGGSESGGCTSAGGSLPAGALGLLVFAGGLVWRRRRRS